MPRAISPVPTTVSTIACHTSLFIQCGAGCQPAVNSPIQGQVGNLPHNDLQVLRGYRVPLRPYVRLSRLTFTAGQAGKPDVLSRATQMDLSRLKPGLQLLRAAPTHIRLQLFEPTFHVGKPLGYDTPVRRRSRYHLRFQTCHPGVELANLLAYRIRSVGIEFCRGQGGSLGIGRLRRNGNVGDGRLTAGREMKSPKAARGLSRQRPIRSAAWPQRLRRYGAAIAAGAACAVRDR